MPHLIRVALSHYQFETIHPFLDGNGRIGRLLITLYLISKGILQRPTLYLSDFFSKNKGAYYDALSIVRTNNNIEHWLKFFLVAVAETAKKGTSTLAKIIALKNHTEQKIMDFGKRSKTGLQLLKYLYSQPVVNAKQTADTLKVTHPTANSLINRFMDEGILKEITGYDRNRLYLFEEYFKLFNA